MERLPVFSRTIASLGYDDETRILEVEYASGRLYRYYDVPAELYADLMCADEIDDVLDRRVTTCEPPFKQRRLR